MRLNDIRIHRNHIPRIMTRTWKVILQTKGLEDRLLSSHHPRKRDAIAWSSGMNYELKNVNRDSNDKSIVVVDMLDLMAKHYRLDK